MQRAIMYIGNKCFDAPRLMRPTCRPDHFCDRPLAALELQEPLPAPAVLRHEPKRVARHSPGFGDVIVGRCENLERPAGRRAIR
jgi:hypothetical protein